MYHSNERWFVKAAGVFVGLVILSSCSQPKPADLTAAHSVAPAAGRSGPAPEQATQPLDIGDVEALARIEATAAKQSRGPGVTVGELRDLRERVNLVNVQLVQPYPEHFWLTVRITAAKTFGKTPVAVRAHVMAEDREVGSLATVFGETPWNQTVEKDVDVFAGLQSFPETMLITVQPEGLLMPEGTDETKIDPLTATASPERITKSIFANPVRIDFVPAQTP